MSWPQDTVTPDQYVCADCAGFFLFCAASICVAAAASLARLQPWLYSQGEGGSRDGAFSVVWLIRTQTPMPFLNVSSCSCHFSPLNLLCATILDSGIISTTNARVLKSGNFSPRKWSSQQVSLRSGISPFVVTISKISVSDWNWCRPVSICICLLVCPFVSFL